MSRRPVSSVVRPAERPVIEAVGAHGATFTVEGDPVPQPRPRVFRNGGVGEDPRATRAKQAVIMAAKRARCPRIPGEVELSVVFWRANARRVDIDNLLKLAMDALLGVAFLDDSQVVSVHARKSIDRARPRTEITVRSFPPEVTLVADWADVWDNGHGNGPKQNNLDDPTAGRAFYQGAP